MVKGQQEVKRINLPHVLCHFGEGVGVDRLLHFFVCVGASELHGFVALQECRSFLARRQACNNSRCAGLWRAGVFFLLKPISFPCPA